MALKKDSRPKKVADIYKTLEALIMMTDDTEELTMLSVVLFIQARSIMLANHGDEKTIVILEQMIEEIRETKSLPKPVE